MTSHYLLHSLLLEVNHRVQPCCRKVDYRGVWIPGIRTIGGHLQGCLPQHDNPYFAEGEKVVEEISDLIKVLQLAISKAISEFSP